MKKATSKTATKVTKAAKATAPKHERGFGTFADVTPITAKNVKTTAAREMTLLYFVLGALTADSTLTNEELFAMVQKAGRDNSAATVGWYAARVRQGHMKVSKKR